MQPQAGCYFFVFCKIVFGCCTNDVAPLNESSLLKLVSNRLQIQQLQLPLAINRYKIYHNVLDLHTYYVVVSIAQR